MGNIKLFVSSADEVMAMDQSFLKIILESHILKNKLVLEQLYNGQQLETVGGKMLRVFLYRSVRTLSEVEPKSYSWRPLKTCYRQWPQSIFMSFRFFLFSSTCWLFLQAVCIENSCLVRGSKKGSNGALHLTRTLLKPATKTMFEILTQNGGFK